MAAHAASRPGPDCSGGSLCLAPPAVSPWSARICRARRLCSKRCSSPAARPAAGAACEKAIRSAITPPRPAPARCRPKSTSPTQPSSATRGRSSIARARSSCCTRRNRRCWSPMSSSWCASPRSSARSRSAPSCASSRATTSRTCSTSTSSTPRTPGCATCWRRCRGCPTARWCCARSRCAGPKPRSPAMSIWSASAPTATGRARPPI